MSSARRRHVIAVALAAVLVAIGIPFAFGAGPPPAQQTADAPTLGPLISGAASLVAGTHVWTDYAYDDRGPDASTASTDNASDLIHLQLRPGRDDVCVRAVLETLLDREVPLLGVGFDLDANPATGARSVPGGQWKLTGTPLGLERLALIDSHGARMLAWDGARWNDAGHAGASVDAAANTMTASLPNALLGTVGPRWRVAGILGLAKSSWADGKGPIHDLAYVRDLPSRTQLDNNFQSNDQAAVLSGARDAAAAMATIDTGQLRAGRTELAAPEPGVRNTLLYRSRLELGEGISSVANKKYAGPYQPYVAWFPKSGLPTPPPMIVFLHGAMSSHANGSYYGGDGAFVTVGPVAPGPGAIDPKALVVTPLGRGETPLGYDGPAEQDVFDVIADASARFAVDADRVVLTGYSLGGVGTFRFAQLYPDRWAGAVEIVGAPDLGALTVEEESGGSQTLPNQLENLRNLPFRMAHSRADELELIVGGVQPDKAALELHRLGYDYRYWQFYRRDHLTFPVATIQCELEQAIARGRVRDPARVVYSQEPAIVTHDSRTGLDLHHDRAYWMSDMVVRGTTFAPGDKGTVDITSLARADREPGTELVAGAGQNIVGGHDVCGENAEVATTDVWTVQGQRWVKGQDQPVSNGLKATLTRVASVTVDVARTGVDVTRPSKVELTTDGDTLLRLAGPWRGPVRVQAGGAAPLNLCPVKGVLEVKAAAGTSTVTLTPAAGRCG